MSITDTAKPDRAEMIASVDPEAERLCTVARTPYCKRLVFAVVMGEHFGAEDRREIRKLAGRGFTIEHITVAEVRKAPFGCKCK